MKRISKSEKETREIAENFANKVLRLRSGQAFVVGLSGELGSGKTTFAKNFAKALGVKERIISPTFVLMKNYQLPITNYQLLIHIDAYRIKNPKEMVDLGWKDMLKNPENIILVEWAENIKKIFPKPYFWINFSHVDEKTRTIDINYIK